MNVFSQSLPKLARISVALIGLVTASAHGAVGQSSFFTLDTRVADQSGDFTLGTGVIGVLADSTIPGSLRDSIAGATPGDTLTFDATLDGMTITLGGTQVAIGKNLTINAATLPNGITLSGNNASRVLEILSGNTVTLSGLTVSGGDAAAGSGGGILNSAGNLTLNDAVLSGNMAALGGAIHNTGGSVTLNDTVLSGNTATTGGAIHNTGTLTVFGAALSGNSSTGAGGALFNTGNSVSFTNVVFSGNTSGTDGGGIYIGPGGNMSLTNATLTGNSAAVGGGVRNDSGVLTLIGVTVSANNATGFGGGLDIDSAQMNIENTIVAANSGPGPGDGRDIRRGGGSIVVVTGANLIGNNDTVSFNFPAGPLVGTPGSPLAPLLAPLGAYGGATPTMALLAGSPAVDTGIATFNTPAFEQRGVTFARVQGAALDIGAYETGNEAGYAIWALERIPAAADSSFSGDAEGDRAMNGNEYAFNFNPAVSDIELHPTPGFVDNGGNLEMHVIFPFRPDATDLLYIVERTLDLESFSEIFRYDTSTGVETITSPPAVSAAVDVGAMEIEVVDTDTAAARTYWRFRTELIAP